CARDCRPAIWKAAPDVRRRWAMSSALTLPARRIGPRIRTGNAGPDTVVVLAIVLLWYVFTVVLNAQWERDQAARAGVGLSLTQLVVNSMSQDRPVLPASHQVIAEMWDTSVHQKVTSRRSLVYHSWVTLSATLLGFAMGTLLGILLAVGIVHNRAMDRSVMPWVVASQTIPILAIAPMIIVVLNAVGLSG